MSRRALQGWGFTAEAVTSDEIAGIASLAESAFGFAPEARAPADLSGLVLAPSRLKPPGPLAAVVSTSQADRCLHAVGRSFPDVVRAFEGDFSSVPDAVARPRDHAEVAAVLEWCAQAGATCVPFGGGTSVVGGVEPPQEAGPVVTLQTRSMDRVVEVDQVSRAALIEAGATGPGLEEQLRPHGLTMRFFPQSFALSTLGGWVATRAGGHYATRLTHIDDLVEAVSAVTPVGDWTSRRLPGSGAGPSPDRLLLGSEGILGVITEAWVRLQDRPRWRASASVRFPDFSTGARAVRALAQSGLDPANCRLLDPAEAMLFSGGDGQSALLVLGLESAHRPVEADGAWALELLADHGGDCPEGLAVRAEGEAGDDDDPAGAWRSSFLRAPYLRDGMVALGMISETFETAVTWDRFAAFHEAVKAATQAALDEVCGGGLVTCRITHAYPDGAAPYYTVIAPSRPGSQVPQWREIKAAASDALLAGGGTITHHHAVGRDHRPWYDRQRPEPFAVALRAAKSAVDPDGLLNPGVLIPTPTPG